MSAQNLKFNDQSLQSSEILTRDIGYNSLPTKEINIKPGIIRDGFDVIDVRYAEKIITISGWLISSSGSGLKDLIDDFKNYLRPQEGNLDIQTYVGSSDYIRWIATTRSIEIPEEHWQVTQKPFIVEFLCQPFGKKTSAEATITLGTGKDADFSYTIPKASYVGNYKAKPTITFTVNNGNDLDSIKLENENNDDWMAVSKLALDTDVFIDGDILEINSEDETVRIYRSEVWTAVDFTGIFPRLKPNSDNKLDITLGTSGGEVDVDATLVYTANYL